MPSVSVTYDPALIFLSVMIAIQGGYVSLSLARQLTRVSGSRRKALLAASAVSLGVGIWAMHFIGMLAVKLPISVNYDVLLTLVSALVAVLVVGLGVFVASFGKLTLSRLAAGGLLMGAGISTMHYIGMSAIRANCVVSYAPPLVAASIVVGMAASTLALWLAFSPDRKPHVMAGAAALGLAISGMHYTAMAAASFLPVEVLVEISGPALSLDLLAIVVAITAFLISGFFLLVLLPDRLTGPRQGGDEDERAAAPASRPAAADQALTEPGRRIPVSSNGTTRLLSAEQIYAVQADAHYTRVFDGHESFFCNLSISELESRLDPERFVRVHRSHIVNIGHAAALKRVQDRGLLELDGQVQHTVPVSRKKMPIIREALGLTGA